MREAYLSELISRARSGYEHYKPYIEELKEAYLLMLKPEVQRSLVARNKSKNYIPKLNAKAKRIADGLSETYFNNETFAKLEPYINSSDDIIAKWQKALDFYTTHINLYKTFAPIFLKIPFSPCCVVKVYWHKDRARIDEVELEDIYFDPDAKSFEDVRFIVHRIYLSLEDIRNLCKQKVFNWKIARELYELNELEDRYKRKELYEIYELIDGAWHVSTMYESTILRDKVELKDGQPFVCGYMLPQVKLADESQFVGVYGEAVLASMLPLQNELNVIRNSSVDTIRSQLNPKLILNKSMRVSADELERVGSPIYAENPTATQIVPTGSTAEANMVLSLIEQDMSEVSGISPQQNGTPTVRKETATMASIMANEGSVRLQGYIRTFNETFFEPIFERVAILVFKYAHEMFFAGYERSEIPSFAINLNTGVGALNKEVQKQSLMDASAAIMGQFNMSLQVGDQEGAINMLMANKKILGEILPLYGIKKPEQFLGEDIKDVTLNRWLQEAQQRQGL